ncbi:MAG: Na+/H+ antiporter NhaC family protein [bacterium]|nr:Na+/H+ antiporter NhaC family protein [bacterium]
MKKKNKFPRLNRGTVLFACFLMLIVWAVTSTNVYTDSQQPQQQQTQETQEKTDSQAPVETPVDTWPPATTVKSEPPAKPEEPKFDVPSFAFKGQKIELEKIGKFDHIYFDGNEATGKTAEVPASGNVAVKIVKNNKEYTFTIYSIPGILTIIPPLIAILLALIFKDVMLALFLGIFSGALFINHYDPLTSFLNVIDKYVLQAVVDKDRMSIIIFTLLLGGMVGVISKSGGVKGIVEALSRKVASSRSTQFYTWLMGVLIFFDDYTNTLVVGNTMRPITDKWNVSREKLAYIVDSTAAPMASIAMISTWIGFEISLINRSLQAYGVDADAYHLFLASLPYRFYPILAMTFVVLVFWLRRDFGPMLKAEIRARSGKIINDNAVPLTDFESAGLTPPKYVTARWYNGLVPILVVIGVTLVGLYVSGKASLPEAAKALADKSFLNILFSGSVLKDMGTIISSANSFQVLLWASLMGAVTAMVMAAVQKILKLKDIVGSMVQGMKSMMMANMILVLAWSLGVVLTEMKTADFLVSLLSEGADYHLFPAIVFVLSSIIAFSTGSSWGTIAIMYPLVIPIIISLLRTAPDFEHFLILTISSILAGAVFGDHCSPISDTTIMSSMASSCDHIDHVRTQLPYAMLTAMIALLIGIIPVSYGFPYLVSIAVAIGLCIAVLLFMGKNPEEAK